MDDQYFGPPASRLLGVMARVAGWMPDQFWRATPADVAAVLGGWAGEGEASAVPVARAALAMMMEHFPDER